MRRLDTMKLNTMDPSRARIKEVAAGGMQERRREPEENENGFGSSTRLPPLLASLRDSFLGGDAKVIAAVESIQQLEQRCEWQARQIEFLERTRAGLTSQLDREAAAKLALARELTAAHEGALEQTEGQAKEDRDDWAIRERSLLEEMGSLRLLLDQRVSTYKQLREAGRSASNKLEDARKVLEKELKNLHDGKAAADAATDAAVRLLSIIEENYVSRINRERNRAKRDANSVTKRQLSLAVAKFQALGSKNRKLHTRQYFILWLTRCATYRHREAALVHWSRVTRWRERASELKALQSGFRDWCSFTQLASYKCFTLKQLAHCVHDPLRILKRLDHVDVLKGFLKWRDTTIYELAIVARRLRVVESVFMAAANRNFAFKRVAFTSWRLVVKDTHQLNIVFRRWNQKFIRVALQTWKGQIMFFISCRRSAKRLMAILKRVAIRYWWKVWSQWIWFSIQILLESQRSKLQSIKKMDGAARVWNTLFRSSNKIYVRVWQAWCRGLEQTAHRKWIIRRIVKHLCYQTLGRAVRRWWTKVTTCVREQHRKSRGARNRYFKLKILLWNSDHKSNSTLKWALHTWINWTRYKMKTMQRSCQLTGVCEQVLGRLKERRISMMFQKWALVVRHNVKFDLERRLQASEQQNNLFARIAMSQHDPLRALKRLERMDLWQSLRTWKAYFLALHAMAHLQEIALSKAMAVVSSVKSIFMRSGLQCWLQHCSTSRMCEILIKRWMRAFKSSALQTWARNALTLASLEKAVKVATKILGRLHTGKVAGAFCKWIEFQNDHRLGEMRKQMRSLRDNVACKRTALLLHNSNTRSLNARWRMWAGARGAKK